MPEYAEFPVWVVRELLGELEAAGFSPALPDGTPRLRLAADRCWVACEPAERDRVAAVVAAHDPAAYEAAAAAAESQDATDRAQVRQVLAALDAGTLTLAQTQKALARLVRVLVRRGVL